MGNQEEKVVDKDHFVDLECGGTTSEEEGQKCVFNAAAAGCGNFSNLLSSGGGWGGFTKLDGAIPGNDHNSVYSCRDSSLALQSLDLASQDQSISNDVAWKDNPKKKSPRKASKPPRPPKPPSLDAADQKLIKEISELAMLKRARIEKMKALRKAKAAKSASSASNLWAMVITIVFCLIIILQGTFSRGSSHLNYHNSPEASMQSGEGDFISIQYNVNASSSQAHDPNSQSPNNVEQMTGSEENERKTTI